MMRLDAGNGKQHDLKGQETEGNRKKRGRQDSVVVIQLDRRQKKTEEEGSEECKASGESDGT